MVWARLDDEILDNTKIIRVGVLGFALHIAAITWCCRNLTDGFVPRAKVRTLLDFSAIGAEIRQAMPCASQSRRDDICFSISDEGGVEPDAIAGNLVDAGLWLMDQDRDGYWLKDFLEYNPSREEVEVRRASKHEVRSEAGRRGGLRSGELRRAKQTGSKAEANDQANGKQIGTPDPDPDPDPDPLEPAGAGSRTRARAEAHPEYQGLRGIVVGPTQHRFDGEIVYSVRARAEAHPEYQSQVRATLRTEIPRDEPLTEPRRARIEANAMPRGVTLDADGEWRKFVATSRANGKLVANIDDAWESWLIDAVRFAERDRRRESDRKAGLTAAHAGPSPPRPLKEPTPEDHKWFAKELAKRVAQMEAIDTKAVKRGA